MQFNSRWIVVCSKLWLLFFMVDTVAAADTNSERVNNGTVAIMTGDIGGAGTQIASDLASVLNEGDRLRVLPIIGQGSLKNIEDLLYLKGVGLAIIQEDVLSFALDNRLFPDLDKKIHYVSKLFSEEVHIVAGPEIKDISDLENKKVNFESESSGNFVTGQTIFETYQIEVEPVFVDTTLGIEKIKSGEIAASVLVTGRPSAAITAIKSEDALHLVQLPFVSGLPEELKTTTFSSDDYPTLMSKNDSVQTLSTDAYLMVFNFKEDGWRYNKIARFIDAYLARFDEFLQSVRHPKWREADLSADLSDWTRFGPVEEWVNANASVASSDTSEPSLKREFQQFLSDEANRPGGSIGPEVDRNQLFQRFLDWQRQRRDGSAPDS